MRSIALSQCHRLLHTSNDTWQLSNAELKTDYITSAGSSPQYLASAAAQAYTRGVRAEPPTGSRGRAPGQEIKGRNAHKAEALLVFGRLSLMEAANLPTFLKFGNAKKSNICVIFAKYHGWPRN